MDNFDAVERPSHYCVGGFECREVIAALELGYNLGNVLKYLWRAGRKGDRLEDLRKAAQYLQWEIEAESKRTKG